MSADEYAIANQLERIAAGDERWVLLKKRLLHLLQDDDADLRGMTGLLREARELAKHISQELGQFAGEKAASAAKAPSVVVIAPQIEMPGIKGELPVVRKVQFPHGAPAGYIEEPEVVDVEPVEGKTTEVDSDDDHF